MNGGRPVAHGPAPRVARHAQLADQDTGGDRQHPARRSLAAADPWARACWLVAIRYLAGLGREFSSDDLRALGVPEWDRRGAAGGLMLAAKAAGLIVPVGWTASRRPSRHGARVRLWRGAAGVDIGEGPDRR